MGKGRSLIQLCMSLIDKCECTRLHFPNLSPSPYLIRRRSLPYTPPQKKKSAEIKRLRPINLITKMFTLVLWVEHVKLVQKIIMNSDNDIVQHEKMARKPLCCQGHTATVTPLSISYCAQELEQYSIHLFVPIPMYTAC